MLSRLLAAALPLVLLSCATGEDFSVRQLQKLRVGDPATKARSLTIKPSCEWGAAPSEIHCVYSVPPLVYSVTARDGVITFISKAGEEEYMTARQAHLAKRREQVAGIATEIVAGAALGLAMAAVAPSPTYVVGSGGVVAAPDSGVTVVSGALTKFQSVRRVEQDIYLVDNLYYMQTQHCHQHVYGSSAIYDQDQRKVIWADGGSSCSVRGFIRK